MDSKFNDITEELIDEGRFGQAVAQGLNTMQKAANKMSPSGGLFTGTGLRSNEYDSKKRYYPNIRSGKWKLIANAKFEDATQIVYERINNLLQAGSLLENTSEPIPNMLRPYIADAFSKYFIDEEIGQIEEHYKRLSQVFGISDSNEGVEGEEKSRGEELRNKRIGVPQIRGSRNPTGRVPSLRQAIDRFRRTRSESDLQNLRDSIETYYKFIEGDKTAPSHFASSISFGYKSYLLNALNDFNTFLNHYETIFRSTGDGSSVHLDDVEPIGGYIKPGPFDKTNPDAGKVYRDKWVFFLNIVANAVVGALQRGWGVGATTYDIMVGAQQPKYTGRGGLQYAGDKNVKTVNPRMAAHFHYNIMKPLFLEGNTVSASMLYLTPEQWESVAIGSKFYKALTSMGKEILSAGSNAPKVSL
jgi:hypothetical protein